MNTKKDLGKFPNLFSIEDLNLENVRRLVQSEATLQASLVLGAEGKVQSSILILLHFLVKEEVIFRGVKKCNLILYDRNHAIPSLSRE